MSRARSAMPSVLRGWPDSMYTYVVNLKNALTDLYQILPGSSTLCFVGDITDGASDAQYDMFMQNLNSVSHPTAYMVMGNHDVRWLAGGYTEAINRYKTKTGMTGAYFDQWIGGYHFIFMATEQDLKDMAYLSTTQLQWLSTKLAENANSSKPIFVFLHQSLYNTVHLTTATEGFGTGGTDGIVQDQQLRDTLVPFPQSVFITGHTHSVEEDPKSVFSGLAFTCANTGAIAYTLGSNGYTGASSEGLCFDVYPNKLVVKGRDFSNKDWVSGLQRTIVYPTPAGTPTPTPAVTATPTPSPTVTPTLGPTATPAPGVAYWKFDETSGTTAADSWGANTGTLNGPVWVAGKYGNALSFDGTNDYVNVAKTDLAVPWTAAMWVKRTDSTVTSVCLMSSSGYMLKLEQYSNTNKVGYTKAGVADYTFNYSAPVGTWTHLAFVGTSSGVSLYVNGTLQQTLTGVISCPMGRIGSKSDGTEFLYGTLDEVKIYNRALSTGEIAVLAQ
jgi:hypothetical protein